MPDPAPPRRELAELSGYAQAVAEGVAGNPGLKAFYEARGYAPIWTTGADADRRAAFFAALGTASMHGLPAARYGGEALRAQFATIRSERERGLLEAQMSMALVSYARDLSSGVLEPKRVDPTIVRDILRPDAGQVIGGFAAAAQPAAFLRDLAPKSQEYSRLLRARMDLGRQIAAGGWGAPVTAGILRPGEEGDQVLALRQRMQAMGYLGRGASRSYDAALIAAVKGFQAENGLKADGVAGPSTLAAVNAAPEDRLRSILVAMERLRWMNGIDLSARHIWVNIPDFSAEIVEDHQVTFRSVAVVGRVEPDYRTPEFSDEMQTVVINPAWHVPRSITVREYLPKMQRNPNASAQIQIVDKAGQVIPRDQVNFAAYNADNFPFRMRQAPSDDNALGQVKFLFPNPWNIYLHDTPSKSLFGKEDRALSHGCIRIGRPFDLAYALLAPQTDDPEAYFQKFLAAGKEKFVTLAQPVPVHLVYFTAWPEADGHIAYRKDVYGRDAALFAALEKAGVELPVLTN
ncbi:murein L,D-transpeptidase [Sinirhodobacter populi]|uniref:Murein L,D-transpeptidase n=2 Tax=Paenirhodobacter populi TaxID=2306993 RepID=A0A443KJI3_9RHOB|nr:murein L,D-transpeptidase [Sinirhodobacter populi]